jgi:hypothetical protein
LRRRNEQPLLKLSQSRAAYNWVRTGRTAAREPGKRQTMFVQPQHQDNSRALGPQPGRSRSIGAPAYYLGRPARLWLSVTSPARHAQ